MHRLAALDQTLRAAGTLLDQAAGQIRDARLEPVRENIRSIGELLAGIFELQAKIYRLRPDLEPKEPELAEAEHAANRRLGMAMLEADDLATAGRFEDAQAHLAAYASSEPSSHHGQLALAQLARYSKPSDA